MNDYTIVTELPGNKAPVEQLKRLYQRYHFASLFCKGKEVLEAACGAGQGLGYLARVAKRVVGGDIDNNNLYFARERYREREGVRVEHLDAQKMPFEDGSFDVVILYEAIYYLEDAAGFMSESRRILKDGGMLIICSANKSWADFNPSPFSTKYFSVPELNRALKKNFPRTDFYGGFPVAASGMKDIVVSRIKRMAVSLDLMPKTMKGKELFKRLFFGKLQPIPPEIEDGVVEYIEPVSILPDYPTENYKVIFAVAYKNG